MYVFEVPSDVRGELVLIADLYYASFPQYILDELFGKDGMKGEIVRMCSVEQTIRVEPAVVAGNR